MQHVILLIFHLLRIILKSGSKPQTPSRQKAERHRLLKTEEATSRSAVPRMDREIPQSSVILEDGDDKNWNRIFLIFFIAAIVLLVCFYKLVH